MADLSEGRELFADINLASDGAHYWVLARVPPSYGPDGGIAAAVDGSASLGPGGHDVTGLSQLAERPRSEATGFLAAMRR